MIICLYDNLSTSSHQSQIPQRKKKSLSKVQTNFDVIGKKPKLESRLSREVNQKQFRDGIYIPRYGAAVRITLPESCF